MHSIRSVSVVNANGIRQEYIEWQVLFHKAIPSVKELIIDSRTCWHWPLRWKDFAVPGLEIMTFDGEATVRVNVAKESGYRSDYFKEYVGMYFRG